MRFHMGYCQRGSVTARDVNRRQKSKEAVGGELSTASPAMLQRRPQARLWITLRKRTKQQGIGGDIIGLGESSAPLRDKVKSEFPFKETGSSAT